MPNANPAYRTDKMSHARVASSLLTVIPSKARSADEESIARLSLNL